MTQIQKLPAPEEQLRVETGAVQFGNDWPGLFIRGDNAMMLKLDIEVLAVYVQEAGRPSVQVALNSLIRMAEMIGENVIVKR